MLIFSLIILGFKVVAAIVKILGIEVKKDEEKDTHKITTFLAGVIELIAYCYIFSYFIQLK